MTKSTSSLKIWGPLAFWSAMFIIGAAIRLAAFNDLAFWFRLPQDAALWAAGLLFSLAVSEQTYLGTSLTQRIIRKEGGLGYSVDYDVTLREEVGFTPKFMYLFLLGVAIWVLTIVLTGFAAREFGSKGIGWLVLGLTTSSYLLATFAVVGAIRALRGVT